jgi:hypothetical protein
MKRKAPKAIYAFHRFIQSIFQHYYDKGMPIETAKARMFKEVYDTCLDFAKKETGIPDHLLVLTMQHASRHLNQRGAVLAKKLKHLSDQSSKDEKQIEELRKALQDLKKAKDAVDQFIETYRGDTYESSSKQ